MECNETSKDNNDYCYQEYYFNKNNIIYKIIIEQNKNLIIIKHRNYMINFNINELSLLIKEEFNNINKAYEYIIDIFEQNRVKIKNIRIKKELNIILIIGKNEYEISLIYQNNDENNDYIINEINKLKNDINYLKDENNKLKNIINDLDNLKIEHNDNDNDSDNECPKDIKLLEDITNDSFTSINIDNTFTVFKSINDILLLIYSNKDKSIIGYDLDEKKIIKEIKNAHNSYITNFRHYLDETNNRDLILSNSQLDNNIRLWELNNWECILNIPHVNKDGILYSSTFLNDNDNNYILSSNCNWDDDNEFIKLYDFDGNKIKEIHNSNEVTFFLDVYYDILCSKSYIITGNLNYIKSYDYNNNKLYHKYYDNENNNNCHFIVVINKKEKQINILDSCDDGIIRIWDFHLGLLINKIKVNEGNLYGMCLWDEKYLFVGCNHKIIKIIDLNEGIIKDLEGHNNEVLTIKKINHNKYGPCLISQGLGNDQIKIWINQN